MTKTVGFIPSRAQSTRFPNKPLADILGRPMLWWTYQRAKQATLLDELYVCTESPEIVSVCESYNIPVLLTSDQHATGTDRLAEAATMVEGDFYFNIQGDEPMIEPENIDTAIRYMLDHPETEVVNLKSEITDSVDLVNPTVPKVVTTLNDLCLYMSRAAVPFPKGAIDYKFYRQICIYGFKPSALKFFAEHPEVAPIERIEGVELLRFMEHGIPLKIIEVEANSIAVDTPNDLEKVRGIMESLTWPKELLNNASR